MHTLRGCALEDLTAELGRSRLRNSAILRTVIADVARGIRSVPEGDLMDLIDSSDLPLPLSNPRLYIDGAFLGVLQFMPRRIQAQPELVISTIRTDAAGR